jgi:predicted lipid carrier protein YhbT
MDREIRPVILRLLLQALPTALVRPGLDVIANLILRRHQRAMARLAPWAGKTFVIAPTDLSRALVLELAAPPKAPRLSLARPQDVVSATAILRGPLADLLDLLEGRADGDALFFSRDLSIEGNVEAVVALRNALDGEDVDLVEDVIAALGPFSAAARRFVKTTEYAASRLSRKLAELQAFMAAPALGRCNRLSDDIEALRQAMGVGADGARHSVKRQL